MGAHNDMTLEKRVLRNLRELFDRYTLNQGLSFSTTSMRVANDGRFYDDQVIENKRRMSVRRYDQIVAAFNEIWPPLLEWPEGVDRINIKDVPAAEIKPRMVKRVPMKRKARPDQQNL